MTNSSSPAIRLESVGKCYRIYQNPQDRFKQALLDRIDAFRGRTHKRPLYREHWALRNVSFEINPGEALGVMGRNGAGKSTLLQVIAGTLDTTEGRVRTSGRITALLELGSGFNYEFTGRENVFLNAQILGLSRDQAAKRFDDIAAFADIGDFIDQPIKTYSSGMVMRLAFAVQTVLEPDILIVDEALSVGDAKFQAKCFRMIRSLRDRGVAILLVSHDVNAIVSFCDRAILMESGELIDSGAPQYIAKRYMEVLYGDGEQPGVTSEAQLPPPADAGAAATAVVDALARRARDQSGNPQPYSFGTRQVEILAVAITDAQGRPAELLTSGETYWISQRIVVHDDVFGLSSGIMVRNRHGIELFGFTNKTAGVHIPHLKPGQILDVRISVTMWLAAGDYFLQVANAGPDGTQYDCRIDMLHFTVIGTPQLFTTSLVNLGPQLSFRLVSDADEERVSPSDQ